MDVPDLARALRAEARRTDERRVLVLAGEAAATRSRARDALDATDLAAAETTVIGPDESDADGASGGADHAATDAYPAAAERLDPVHARDLLGRTRDAVALDARASFSPNALGAAVGAVDGGGLLLLLAPPLDAWPERRDAFDESLAVPPFSVAEVAGNFRRRLVATLRAHPGVAIVDVDAGTVERDGLTDPAPRLRSAASDRPAAPADASFPVEAYEACRTADQVDAVAAFEPLAEAGHALVVEADRGRGKSSAAGLAAAALALAGRDVLVTAPQYRGCREVFERAEELLATLDALDAVDDPETPRLLTAGEGRVRYEPVDAATELPGEPDAVVVDEAAALPVRVLAAFLSAPSVAYTTTVHGYEGAGRGFSVRFRDRLAESDLSVSEVTMHEPIRFAPADPVESWAFRALLLDARPAVDPLVADATPESVEYDAPTAEDLLADEHRLREAFGLLVLAHYRTEPDDLARLLDAPNVAVRALTHEGRVVSVALLAREGDLPADLRASMYAGERVRGNMIPDVLTTQLRDEAAGETVGRRVLRIATHPAVRSRGLGSRLLADVRAEFADAVDWLGVGYGATAELVSFWAANGYRTVHLSSTRNDASGEYSAIMLDPCSPDGRALADRHAEWFLDRIGDVLADALADLDPDVARAALRSADGSPEPDLSAWEWRLAAGITTGASTFDTAPGPVRRLALAHLVDPADADALTDRQERLLVRRALQGTPWEVVAEEMEYVSTAECMRALGRSVESLVRLYGDDTVVTELDPER